MVTPRVASYADSLAGIPSRNSACLCGSGLKFKRCCSERWRSHDHGEKYVELAKSGQYHEAIVELRSQITWYRICHARHTVPLVSRDAEAGERILSVDIEALYEMFCSLLRFYNQAGLSGEVNAVFDAASGAIKDARWDEKEILLRLRCALGGEWNEVAGRRELRKYRSLVGFQDPELLMVGLDLLGNEMSFSDRQKVISKILTLVDDPYHILHYRSARAAGLLAAYDHDGSKAEIIEAVKEFDASLTEVANANSYEATVLTRALHLAFGHSGDEAFARRGIDVCGVLLSRGGLLPAGISAALQLRGELQRDLGRYEEAIMSFRAAHAEEQNFLAVIFEAECELLKGQFIRARSLLGTVDSASLTDAGVADFLFISARTACAQGDKEFLLSVESRLERLNFRDPLFEVQKLRLLADVRECQKSSQGSKGFYARGVLGILARYGEFKPNVFGIGINLNAILDDWAERRAEIVRSKDR